MSATRIAGPVSSTDAFVTRGVPPDQSMTPSSPTLTLPPGTSTTHWVGAVAPRRNAVARAAAQQPVPQAWVSPTPLSRTRIAMWPSDEPGAVMELYSFARAIGLDIRVIGKGKNNKIDYDCNPDTVYEEAVRRKMNPRMLTSFKDGTKTMVEMTAMSNATGLVPDVIGGHGPSASPKDRCADLNEIFKLKKDGGILSKHGVVEYVNGIAPGVFVTVTTQNEEIAYQMGYHSMGPGPLWTLYRPYHLCNLETPLTVAKIVIDGEPTIIPLDGPVSECITVAKRDLKAGETIDGIGGYTTYGSIATAQETYEKGYVVYALVNKNARMKCDVKKGTLLTLDMVDLDTSTQLYQVRKEQDKMYNNGYALK